MVWVWYLLSARRGYIVCCVCFPSIHSIPFHCIPSLLTATRPAHMLHRCAVREVNKGCRTPHRVLVVMNCLFACLCLSGRNERKNNHAMLTSGETWLGVRFMLGCSRAGQGVGTQGVGGWRDVRRLRGPSTHVFLVDWQVLTEMLEMDWKNLTHSCATRSRRCLTKAFPFDLLNTGRCSPITARSRNT